MTALSILFGALVGFSLGLTGGGGAIFAVPLLVYAIGLPGSEAVGVSLMTVGVTALVGFIERARRGLVEFPTGLLFAVAGMLAAPIGSWLAGRIPEAVLLSLFAALMVVVAVRMWRQASRRPEPLAVLEDENAGPTCRRDPEGKLRLTSRCALLLVVVGAATGLLSGLFGVGGGFIIVPALVMFSQMGIQRAIGTSLLVITLVALSGTTSYLLAGRELSVAIAALFGLGSIVGLFGGSWLARRLAGPRLEHVFAAAIVMVAGYMLLRTMVL